MTVPARFTAISVWLLPALFVAACGQASFAPTSPSEVAGRSVLGAAPGAVITGTVNGMAFSTTSSSDWVSTATSTPVTVTVVGTDISTTVDGAGRFELNNVPVGDVQLKFAATGLDATITLRGVEAGDRIDVTVRVTDSSVRIEAERREHRGNDGDDGDEDHDFRCMETISSPLNRPVLVPSGQTCVVDASVNGNVKVHGTLVLLEGRRINGNIDLVNGTVDARPNSRISGNIMAKAAIVLAAALVEGNVRYVSPGGLTFASGLTIIRGNLEFEAPTNVSGGGNVTVFGNVRCKGNVVDDHTGMVVTTGQQDGCPSTFNGQS